VVLASRQPHLLILALFDPLDEIRLLFQVGEGEALVNGDVRVGWFDVRDGWLDAKLASAGQVDVQQVVLVILLEEVVSEQLLSAGALRVVQEALKDEALEVLLLHLLHSFG